MLKLSYSARLNPDLSATIPLQPTPATRIALDGSCAWPSMTAVAVPSAALSMASVVQLDLTSLLKAQVWHRVTLSRNRI